MARAMRKVRVGAVVRTGMEKTAVVEMVWKQRHRLYGKQMRRVARFRVHDPLNQCQLGDVVRIEETRPISKTKHWRLLEIMQRRQVADVRPMELEADAEIPETTVAEDVVEQPEDSPEDSIEDLTEDTGAETQASEVATDTETEPEAPVDEDESAVDSSGSSDADAGQEEDAKE